ncbi:MAG: efflux RND transporter periplasmic adaptor subunit [Candidatus Cloacimonetes bacterium]|nr:efflux RND transporter periplasmic adaptor subunit [Candidatus Cloacimonadota bacterium]
MRKLIFIMMISLILLAACNIKPPGLNGDGPIQTTLVKVGSIVVKLEELGEIRPLRDVDIKTKVGGKIVRLHVRENEVVTYGQLIADIEPTYEELSKISQIQRGLKQAEIRLKDARKAVEDQRLLLEQNYSTRTEFENAEDELALAQLNYEDLARQYELISEIDLDASIWRVTATAAGTIISLPIEEGEMVRSDIGSYSEGTVIAKVADLGEMIVAASINEVDISKLSLDQKVTIRVDALPYREYHGRVSQVAAMTQYVDNVKVFPIEISIDDADEALRPGLTASISIVGETRDSILVIPIRAIFVNRDGMDIVWRYENGAIIDSVIVKTGINDFTRVEIIEGVAEGDSLALSEPRRRGQGNGHAEIKID